MPAFFLPLCSTLYFHFPAGSPDVFPRHFVRPCIAFSWFLGVVSSDDAKHFSSYELFLASLQAGDSFFENFFKSPFVIRLDDGEPEVLHKSLHKLPIYEIFSAKCSGRRTDEPHVFFSSLAKSYEDALHSNLSKVHLPCSTLFSPVFLGSFSFDWTGPSNWNSSFGLPVRALIERRLLDSAPYTLQKERRRL